MLRFVSQFPAQTRGFLKWLIQSSQDTPRVAVTQQKVKSADSTPLDAPREQNQFNSKRTRVGPDTRSMGVKLCLERDGDDQNRRNLREHRAFGWLTWKGGSDELLVGSNTTALCVYLFFGRVVLLQSVWVITVQCLCCVILSVESVSWRLIRGQSCTQNQKR